MDDTNILSPVDAPTDCTRFAAQCGGYLERDLDHAEHAWMTAHQSACASCGALVRELETILAESRTLPGIAPSRDLWSGIEARLDTTVIPISAAAHRLQAQTRVARTVSVRTFAIAATMLVAVTSGVTWRLVARGTTPTTVPTTSLPSSTTLRDISFDAGSNGRDGADADVVYEREISALRRIVDERVVELDTATVRELRRNLDIIDQAISDSRGALARDPRSALLATQLDRALETKLALLRRVALL